MTPRWLCDNDAHMIKRQWRPPMTIRKLRPYDNAKKLCPNDYVKRTTNDKATMTPLWQCNNEVPITMGHWCPDENATMMPPNRMRRWRPKWRCKKKWHPTENATITPQWQCDNGAPLTIGRWRPDEKATMTPQIQAQQKSLLHSVFRLF